MLVTEIETQANTQENILEALRSRLIRCSVVISMGCDSYVDLTELRGAEATQVIATLTELVESRTCGHVTVRPAHSALALKADPETISIVRCFTDEVSPDKDEPITELTRSMDLLGLQFTRDGFLFRVPRANRETVEARLAALSA